MGNQRKVAIPLFVLCALAFAVFVFTNHNVRSPIGLSGASKEGPMDEEKLCESKRYTHDKDCREFCEKRKPQQPFFPVTCFQRTSWERTNEKSRFRGDGSERALYRWKHPSDLEQTCVDLGERLNDPVQFAPGDAVRATGILEGRFTRCLEHVWATQSTVE